MIFGQSLLILTWNLEHNFSGPFRTVLCSFFIFVFLPFFKCLEACIDFSQILFFFLA
jgi:hypothetical protein